MIDNLEKIYELTLKSIEMIEKNQESNHKLSLNNLKQLKICCISILIISAIFCLSIFGMWNVAYNGESYEKNENINRNVNE